MSLQSPPHTHTSQILFFRLLFSEITSDFHKGNHTLFPTVIPSNLVAPSTVVKQRVREFPHSKVVASMDFPGTPGTED